LALETEEHCKGARGPLESLHTGPPQPRYGTGHDQTGVAPLDPAVSCVTCKNGQPCGMQLSLTRGSVISIESSSRW